MTKVIMRKENEVGVVAIPSVQASYIATVIKAATLRGKDT
jgi:hypothetical protein